MKHFVGIVFGLLFFLGCNQPKTSKLIHTDIRWRQNDFAELFQIGQSKSDTFVKLFTFGKNGKRELINQFFWGTSPADSFPEFIKINRRNRCIALTGIFVRYFKEIASSEKITPKIVAVDQLNYLPEKLRSFISGAISVQPNGQLLLENALNAHPDIILGYYISENEKVQLNRLHTAEHPVLHCQTHLEKHPLGRSEWIKFFAALSGQFNSPFELWKTQYDSIKHLSNNRKIPTMVNLPYSGNWDVPKSNSYFSNLVKDAGGECIWLKNNQFQGTGSAPIGLEQGINFLNQSKVWLNIGMCDGLDCIVKADKRLNNCSPMKFNQIFQNDKKIESSGANEYWDLGAVNPSIVLNDLHLIFESVASSNRVLTDNCYFYRRLK